jgi:hypothetical protein
MLARTRDRLARLEAEILPRPRVFVMFRVEEPGIPHHAEQLAAFKSERNVGPRDQVSEVTFTFS